MADNGLNISKTKTFSEDVPKRGPEISILILSFFLKCMDTCCELIKTVKFLPKAIQNPTEGIVDVQVESKGEGEWSAKYPTWDYKVGSLSDGTDTVSYDGTEKSVTRFFNDLMKKLIGKVQYHPLDCDTMHVIGDVTITQEDPERSETDQEARDNEECDKIKHVETKQLQNEQLAKKNKDDTDKARKGTRRAADDQSGLTDDKARESTRRAADDKSGLTDDKAREGTRRVADDKSGLTDDKARESTRREADDKSKLTDDKARKGTRRAEDDKSGLIDDKARKGMRRVEDDISGLTDDKARKGTRRAEDDKSGLTDDKGRECTRRAADDKSGLTDDKAREGTRRAVDDKSGLYENQLHDNAYATSGKRNVDEIEAARDTEQVTKMQSLLTRARNWPLCKFEGESIDSKLEVFVETSKNPGYLRLKLNISQQMAKHQNLFLSKSDESNYLKKPKPNIVKDLVTSYVQKCGLKSDVAIMVNEPKYKILIFCCCKDRAGKQNNSETKDTSLAFGVDWVPCLTMLQWPKEAEEWITRDRKSNWPSRELVDEVVKAGCHVVPKSHSDNRDDVTEWRISFSKAERILAMQLSEMQRTCFRMFKMVTQLHCKVIVDDKEEYPSSYALKTIFLWACEEIEAITWEQEVGSCFLTLFEKLAEALEKKSIQGYFIREMNLIGHLDTNLIQEYLGTVQEILREPIRFLENTWKLIIEPKLGWTFDRTFGELIRCADRSEESQDIAQARCCLNIALMTNDYICQGAVTRNSFLMKMLQEIYGYQRSNKADMKMIENKVDQNLHVAESDNKGLHTVEELLDICWHISSKHAANPAVRFGIHPQAFILSGDVDYMQGRVQEAKKNFEKAIEILTTEGCRVAARSMSRVHTQYAKCLTALKAPNAMQEYEKALRLDRNNTGASVFKVMHLYNTGQKEVAKTIIKGVFGCQIVNSGAKGSLLPKENMNMIQLSRGDLTLLDDEVLCSEVKALLNWPVNIPRVPYRSMSEAVLKVSVPEVVILSLLYMKGKEITKATLNNELRPWVNLIADAGKTGRADCQYIVNSLLGMMHHKAGNYWEALKLLKGLEKTTYCSEMVLAYLDLLKTLFKITIE